MGRGFALHARVAAEVIRAAARDAEAARYDSFWVNYPGPVDGLASLALAASETERIALGVGVVPLHTRGPDSGPDSIVAGVRAETRADRTGPPPRAADLAMERPLSPVRGLREDAFPGGIPMPDAGDQRLTFGSDDLRLPDALRGPLRAHLAALRERYRGRGWGGPMGFGHRPALVVIDLALAWTDPRRPEVGSAVDSVVEAAARVLVAARAAGIFTVFTTWAYDPAAPPSPHDAKNALHLGPGDEKLLELDPRIERRPTELLLRKRYASAFKGTNLHEMLAAQGIDTLIVTGLSTSHCVYATCRDATDSFRVIVPREAVGERCELFHEVNLLDIELDLGDVVLVDDVLRHLATLGVRP